MKQRTRTPVSDVVVISPQEAIAAQQGRLAEKYREASENGNRVGGSWEKKLYWDKTSDRLAGEMGADLDTDGRVVKRWSKSFSYDEAGRMTGERGWNYTPDGKKNRRVGEDVPPQR